MTDAAPMVLVVDDDLDIARLVEAVLMDEGIRVAQLHAVTPESLARVVGQLEPDCVLLDGQSDIEFGGSWQLAEMLAVRGRPVPVVMFTGHQADVREAQAGETPRSRAAALAGVLSKPFDLDELVDAVARATGRSHRFDRSVEADIARTDDLVGKLEAGGATEVRHATAREWVIFRAPSGRVTQLYWWQKLGLYLCGAYDEETGRMIPIGRFPRP